MKNSIPYCGSLTLTLLPEATLGFYVEPDFHPLEYVRAGRSKKRRSISASPDLLFVSLLVFSGFSCCVFSKKLGLNVTRNRLVISKFLLEGS